MRTELSHWRHSKTAQMSWCSGDSGVGVESLFQFKVKLALFLAENSGTGKATWKATPVAKMRTEITRMSPLRRISSVTESSVMVSLEVFSLCSAPRSAPTALKLLSSASGNTFSS